MRRYQLVSAWFIGAVLVVCVAVMAGGIAVGRPQAAQSDTFEGTCHDPQVGAHNTKLLVRLMVTPVDWDALRGVLDVFAQKRGWSILDNSEVIPGEVRNIDIDICKTDLFGIRINQNLWSKSMGGSAHDLVRSRISIGFKADVSASTWQPIARAFVRALEARWPGHVLFVNGVGEIIKRPAYLAPKRAGQSAAHSSR